METVFFGDGKPVDSRDVAERSSVVLSWKYYEGGSFDEGVACGIWCGNDTRWIITRPDRPTIGRYNDSFANTLKRHNLKDVLDWLWTYSNEVIG